MVEKHGRMREEKKFGIVYLFNATFNSLYKMFTMVR